MDVEAAMAEDAPLLHDNIFTARSSRSPRSRRTSPRSCVSPRAMSRPASRKPTWSSNGALHDRSAVPGLYRAARLSGFGRRRRPDNHLQFMSQGQFMVRAYTARICGADIANIRAIPAEDQRRLWWQNDHLSRTACLYAVEENQGRPVKIVMSREEVFTAPQARPPVPLSKSSSAPRGTPVHITAAQSILKYQAGAFPGSPVQQGCICGMAVYDFPNALTVGYDVVCNRPKVRRTARRARRSRRTHWKAASTSSHAN